MSKKILYALIVLTASIGILYIFFISDYEDIKKGNLIISEIESYKNNTGKLPENSYDFKAFHGESTGPYYEKKDSINYVVYFTEGFDNMFVYYSNTMKWEDRIGSSP